MGYFYRQEYICLSQGVHLRLPIERKNIFILYIIYFQIFIQRSVNIIFKNHNKNKGINFDT